MFGYEKMSGSEDIDLTKPGYRETERKTANQNGQNPDTDKHTERQLIRTDITRIRTDRQKDS